MPLQLCQRNTPATWSCYDAISYSIIVHRQGKILYVNPAAVNITGLQSEELQSVVDGREPGWEILCENGLPYPTDASEAQANAISILSGNRVVFGLLREGAEHPCWLLADSRPLSHSGDEAGVMVTSFVDISPSIQAEESLKLTRFALDRAADAVFWLDSAGRFLYANQIACTLFGSAAEEICTLAMADFYPECSEENWLEYWSRIKEQGSLTIELVYRRRDGQEIPLEITANYLESNGKEYCFAFARDISERKQAADALRESEEKYRNLVECSNDWIWEIDKDNRYSYASPRIYEMLGLTPEEVLGKTPFDLMTVESRLKTYEVFMRAKERLEPFSLFGKHPSSQGWASCGGREQRDADL